ncbi:MAG: condensation domain-containing protein, partial [Rhodocyclaceae bacterium]
MKSAFTVSVTDLLAGLEGRGVHLWYEGPQLRFRAPQGALGAEQRAELAARRDEVLAALRARDAAQTTFAPLSYGQRSLWLVQQQNPASVAYNVAFALSIRSPLPPQRLREALQALADRHAILRTTYVPVDGQPQQRIAGEAAAPLEVLERPGLDDAALHALLAADYARAFDLVNGPVWRCTLVTRAPEDHAFLLCAHHIATDGWSLLVMLDELRQWLSGLAAGRAPVLPLPGHAYADYVTWQREMLAGPEGKALGRYWEDKLRLPRAEVELPGDRPRPPHKSFRGASLEFRLAAPLTARLQQFAKAEGTTLFVLMLAAFKLLLHRWSGLEDIVVGTPTLGRAKGQFDRTLGDFMNPVPLRTQVLPAMDFRSLLGSVRQTLVEALDHQDFPFARIVERLQPVRDPSRSPLFETAFVLQRFDAFGDLSALLNAAPEDAWRDFGGLQVQPYALAQQDGQFDLSLGLVDTGASLSGAFKYNTDLFEGETIERLLGHYERLLEALLERPGVPIDKLAMLGEEERRQLLLGWNSTAADYAREQTVHGLFEAQVQRTPEAPALQFEGEVLSYRELNTRANRLAHHLRSLGVGRGALVGVWLERSVEMVVAVLGALKAGAAYIPLDPAFPQERIDYMMADAALALVPTQQR